MPKCSRRTPSARVPQHGSDNGTTASTAAATRPRRPAPAAARSRAGCPWSCRGSSLAEVERRRGPRVVAAGGPEVTRRPPQAQAATASPARSTPTESITRSTPSRPPARAARRPSRRRCSDAGVGAELAARASFSALDEVHEHPCPGLPGERDRERRDAAAGTEHEHGLARPQAAAREERAVGREAGEGKRRGLLPGEAARAAGRGSPRARRSAPRRFPSRGRPGSRSRGPGSVLVAAPGHRRQDHDLLAGVAPHAGAVGAEDQRQLRGVGARRTIMS